MCRQFLQPSQTRSGSCPLMPRIFRTEALAQGAALRCPSARFIQGSMQMKILMFDACKALKGTSTVRQQATNSEITPFRRGPTAQVFLNPMNMQYQCCSQRCNARHHATDFLLRCCASEHSVMPSALPIASAVLRKCKQSTNVIPNIRS